MAEIKTYIDGKNYAFPYLNDGKITNYSLTKIDKDRFEKWFQMIKVQTSPSLLTPSTGHKAPNFYVFGKSLLRDSATNRDKSIDFQRKHWGKTAKSRFFSLGVDPKYGGLGFSLKQELCAYRNFAKGSLDLPFTLSCIAHGVIAIELLTKFGNQWQIDNYLPKMMNGDFIGAVANSEASGTDVTSARSKVIARGDGYGEVSFFKKCASNISDADLVFVSAWKVPTERKPSLEIFIFEKDQVSQSPLNDNLMGFQTGQTGSVSSNDNLVVDLKRSQLGEDRTGFAVMKSCFHIERIFIAASIVGVLDAMLEMGMVHVNDKKTFGKPLAENQYIQEKIIKIFSAREKIWSLIESVVDSEERPTKRSLDKFSKRLSIIKNLAIEDGLAAATAFCELFGYQSYTKDHVSQKLLRDIFAFKFLGGTRELQNIVLFDELQKDHASRTKK